MLSEALGILRNISENSSKKSAVKDENHFFGSFISTKLNNYSEIAKNAVQQAILQIIFKADEGHFNCPNHLQTHNRQYSYHSEEGGYNSRELLHPAAASTHTPSSAPSPSASHDSDSAFSTEDLI